MAEAFEPIPIFVSGDSAFAKQLRAGARSNPRFELVGLESVGAVRPQAGGDRKPRIALIEFDIANDAAMGELPRDFPEAGLILFGSLRDPVQISRALAWGGTHALEYMPIPPAMETTLEVDDYINGYMLPRARRLARALPERPPKLPVKAPGASDPEWPRAANRDRSQLSGRFDLCAIGVSAGGPRALERLLGSLPPRLNGAIVIAQHMPEGFTAQLAQSLNLHSPLKVVEAQDGLNVERGAVYLAPGGYHTTVRRRGDRMYLNVAAGPAHNHCQPSIDLLFESLAEVIPTRTLAILMTGMGSDGCEGLRKLKAARAYGLAQNEASCTIFGIPARAIEAGLVDEVLAIEGLAERIASCLGLYNPRDPAAAPGDAPS
ncbi:MAG: CheB methylesterase domain-containing protein [bacterium]|nr:CheB methylesterase domain-containing protein [bacterium]